MATSCMLNCLRQNLKLGQNGAGITKSFLVSNSATLGNQRLCFARVHPLAGCTQAQMISTTASCHGKRGPSGTPFKGNVLKTKKPKKTVIIGRAHVYSKMTLQELAIALKKPTDHIYDVLEYIKNTDHIDSDDTVLSDELIIKIVKDSGMIPEFVSKKPQETAVDRDAKRQPPPKQDDLVARCPVVTIMGHVDHGKTTLLDQLRQSKIVDQEFGGITQHIGAFMVNMESGESICFLDTPGHAAFSAMRHRGANLTDIVVLVVAADDGVMQQTKESIHFAKEAGVPIIVAINKIDKNNADVERTKNMLMEHELVLEEFGGEVQAVPISALQGTNLLELQEAIVTQAELMSLRADPKGLVEGRVVESCHDDKRGRLATVVIQRGTLKKKDCLVAGTAWAKVRAMFNDHGQPIQEALPGTPVEILGWKDEIPAAGEEVLQLEKESEVKSILAWRRAQLLEKKAAEDSIVIQDKREEHHKVYHARLMERRAKGIIRERNRTRTKEVQDSNLGPQLSIVLKGDVDGSVEAILDTLDTYSSTKCRLDLIHYGVGNVTESDVEMAAVFNGEIYAFNTDIPSALEGLAKHKGIRIKHHTIIYRLFDDIKESLNKRLPKLKEDVILGEANVMQVYQITLPNKKKAMVAGCRCIMGNISKKFNVKVIRNDETVYDGPIDSLKHFRSEVESVKKEQECGICLEDRELVFHSQDRIVCYDVKEVDQEVEWTLGF